jgi:hypothetical protein
MGRGESDGLGDGRFLTGIVTQDGVPRDTHRGAALGARDSGNAQAILPDVHGVPQHLPTRWIEEGER